jgi:hypothetical protein
MDDYGTGCASCCKVVEEEGGGGVDRHQEARAED